MKESRPIHFKDKLCDKLCTTPGLYSFISDNPAKVTCTECIKLLIPKLNEAVEILRGGE